MKLDTPAKQKKDMIEEAGARRHVETSTPKPKDSHASPITLEVFRQARETS